MSMTPQEQAFHDWANSQETFGYDYLEIWVAACKWQLEQDIKYVDSMWPHQKEFKGALDIGKGLKALNNDLGVI